MCLLAGFLIAYHAMKLFTHFHDGSESFSPELIFRPLIIISLLMFLLQPKIATIAMWLSIGAFVAFQIIGLKNMPFIQMIAPLKGLMIPFVMTLLMFKIMQQK